MSTRLWAVLFCFAFLSLVVNLFRLFGCRLVRGGLLIRMKRTHLAFLIKIRLLRKPILFLSLGPYFCFASLNFPLSRLVASPSTLSTYALSADERTAELITVGSRAVEFVWLGVIDVMEELIFSPTWLGKPHLISDYRIDPS